MTPDDSSNFEVETSRILMSLGQQNALKGRRVLIIVENLPLPFDRRVWQEARTLVAAGASVSIICPKGKGFQKSYEYIEGVHIYRHPLRAEGSGVLGYLVEYSSALFWETLLAWKLFLRERFDVIHGCNPPDLIFLVALQFKIFGVKFIFDHHDINPELYEAKFGKRGRLWRLMNFLERCTFKASNVSIATNESYRKIAVGRGGMDARNVFVVRSGPDIAKLKPVRQNDYWRNGREYLVGYVGVMGEQEGIDLLISAVRHLVKNKKRTDIQFCLIGGGPSLPGLQSLVKDEGLEAYVTFTGRVSDDDLLEILSTMDLGVNPDRVNDMNNMSTMNKIMEYMALAKPIVQFDVIEGRYSAQNASLYAKANDPIDFANKITELLGDRDTRVKMGLIGYERVKTSLSWAYQVQPLIAAYKRALCS